MRSIATTISAPLQADSFGPNRALLDRVQTLRPPKRGFLARVFGLVTRMGESQLNLAKLLHGQLQFKAKIAVQRPAAAGATMPAGALGRTMSGLADAVKRHGRNTDAIFREARRYASRNPDDVRGVLASKGAAEIIRDLCAPLVAQGLTAQRAQAVAEIAYSALVADVAEADEQGGFDQFSSRLKALEDASRPLSERLGLASECDAALRADQGLSGDTRQRLYARLVALRKDMVGASAIDRLTADVSVATPLPVLAQRVADAARIRETLAEDKAVPARERLTRLEKLDAAAAFLGALQSRGAFLDSLAAQPTLRTLIEKLDARGFVAARHGIEHILNTVADSDADTVRRTLDALVRHPDQLRWLDDIRQGDAGIIDMVFRGPEWDEDAYRLKRFTLDRDHAGESRRIEAGHEAGPTRDAALAKQSVRQEKALRDLDVQHNLRMAASGLDHALRLLRQSDDPTHKALPASAFGALKADAAFIGWLVRNAPAFVKDADLLIANWISLSLYDPKSGQLDTQQAQALFKQLGVQGLDVDRIRTHVQQGFGSVAAIVACRERLQAFARAVEESPGLLGQLEETRALGVRLERVTSALVGEAIRKPVALSAGPEIDLAMRDVFASLAPWVPHEEAMVRLEAERDRDLAFLCAAEAGDDLDAAGLRDWVTDAAERTRHGPDHALVAKALLTYDQMRAPGRSAAQREADTARLQDYLGQLKGFNARALRRDTASKEPPRISDLVKRREHLQALDRLATNQARYDEQQAKALRRPGDEARAAAFIHQAVRIAILQQAAAEPEGFTPQAQAAGIFKRLKAFGLDNASASPWVRDFLQQLADGLSADQRGAAEVCSSFDPASARNQAARKFGSAVAAVKSLFERPQAQDAAPAGSHASAAPLAVSDIEKQRRDNAAMLERRFRELQPGQSFNIRFGVYGTVSVSVPTPLIALSAKADSRAERSHGMTVGVDESGRFSLQLHDGGHVRQGVSVTTVRGLLEISGRVGVSRAQGQRFEFAEAAACRELALKLMQGEPIDPTAWVGATVRQVDARGRDAGARATLTLDAEIASVVMQADVSAGISHESRRGAQGRTDVFTRQLRATASIEASAAGGRAAAEKHTGLDLRVRKHLDQQSGMLTGARLDVAAAVVGDDALASLRAVLPPPMDQQAGALRERLGPLEEGAELFVRYRLSPAALVRARELLGQANQALLEAALAPAGARRDTLRSRMQQHIREAFALTSRAENYRAEGLGWTTRSQVEVARSRGMYTRFAADETLESSFLPFEEAATPPAAAVF